MWHASPSEGHCYFRVDFNFLYNPTNGQSTRKEPGVNKIKRVAILDCCIKPHGDQALGIEHWDIKNANRGPSY